MGFQNFVVINKIHPLKKMNANVVIPENMVRYIKPNLQIADFHVFF